jgi:hypothetical protein
MARLPPLKNTIERFIKRCRTTSSIIKKIARPAAGCRFVPFQGEDTGQAVAKSVLAGLVFDFVLPGFIGDVLAACKGAFKTNTSSPPFIPVARSSYEELPSVSAPY